MDRIEQEIRTQKKLLGLVGEDEDGQPDGAGEGEGEDEGGGGDGEEGGMEVDREGSAGVAEEEGGEVRGTACKTKEGTSDQSHKRSLSISSVETSGTRASRSNKRVRKT